MHRYLIVTVLIIVIGLAATMLLWPEEQAPLEEQAAEAQTQSMIELNEKVSTGEVFQDVFSDGEKGPIMVQIAGGRFTMGSPEDEKSRSSDENQVKVRINKPFAVGKFEVTFAEYDVFAQQTGRERANDEGWGRGLRPVINVTWLDALAYAAWIAEKTGQPYRLPTEAEWEFMARAGTQTPFWWGTFDDPDDAVCTGCDNWKKREPAPVGQFAANAYGVHDVLGNVWEWTCSNYSRKYDGSQLRCAQLDDETPKSIRGGSWVNTKQMLRAAVRDKFVPGDRNEIVGFRLARDL